MIRRFANLLLVLLVVANQGVSLALVHSHDGSAANHAIDETPHVHVGGHSPHGHHGHHGSAHHHHHHGDHSHSEPIDHSDADDQTDLSLDSPVADHDGDAVYCVNSPLAARHGGQLTEAAVGCACIAIPAICDDDVVEQHRPRAASAPPVVTSTCPVYLRTLSLRI